MANNNNETVHISLGTTANHITSHLLNLQGLAATTKSSSSEDFALCDPSVTHDISPIDSDHYSSGSNGGGGSRYMYVPRTLIVDGRDSFGTSWGGVSSNQQQTQQQPRYPQQTSTTTSTGSDAWSGEISLFNASDHANIFGGNQQHQQQQSAQNDDTRIPQQTRIENNDNDPLHTFQNAASIMGLSPMHSRFNATLPSHSSYNINSSGDTSRHVQWDEEGEEEEDEEDDYYYRNEEEKQEEKRRQLERLEYQQMEERKNWNTRMEDSWEETFYGGCANNSNNNSNHNANAEEGVHDDAANSNDMRSASTNGSASHSNSAAEREIQWYDYWMPPKPSPTKYQVSLPFDTALTSDSTTNNKSSSWSTSFNMGYNPTSGGSGTMSSNASTGITHSWRENVLSESLRKVLEGCDIVKGFNIVVDGGDHKSCGVADSPSSSAMSNGSNKHTKQLSNILAGGGFHAGLATSLFEELSEECRSAGRWAIMIDPLSSPSNIDTTFGDENNNTNSSNTEGNQVHQFRQCVNAGLALHGLSTNSDAFLPVSINGAFTALRGRNDNNDTGSVISNNRMLFEGSAAIALSLEASTLFYRLNRRSSSSHASGRSGGYRSRIGIQSGFYQGSSGNAGYEDFDNEPYATAPSLTYHEFLACARPSSDRRRSILELDALLRPISYPSSAANATPLDGGINVASLLSSGGVASVSPSILASLTSSGLISGGGTNTLGELQKRMMRGTSVERMRMEQNRQQYRSSRNRAATSSSTSEPGDWMEDMTTNTGLLSSLSGNSTPFGKRANHHHFALSTSLRPSASDSRSFTATGHDCATSAYLRSMMESMGVKYRPEVSLGAVVKDTVVDLTGVGSYWRSVFTDRGRLSSGEGGGNLSTQQAKQHNNLTPNDIASHTPILSVLGNSTRSYPRLNSISTGFVSALHSRRNMGYISRDVMSCIMPEKDDCEEALEYCQELVDVYEPPMGSGLVLGEDENCDLDAYFDEEDG